MELPLEQYEKIQLYLDGKMLPQEEKTFLKEADENKVLQEYLLFERELRDNLALMNTTLPPGIDFNIDKRSDDATRFKSLVEKAGKEWMEGHKIKPVLGPATSIEKKTGKISSFPSWLTIAAAACLLSVVAGILWFRARQSSPGNLANNTKHDSLINKNTTKPGIPVSGTKDSPANLQPALPTINFTALYKKFYKKDNAPERKPMLLADALDAYNNSDYTKLQNFNLSDLPVTRNLPGNSLNTTQNMSEIGHYYKGLSFMQSNKMGQASANLQWTIDSAKNQQLVAKAQWYLALCYLQKQNSSKTITLLTTVASKNISPYNQQAKELLMALQ